jgi:hypothetical protein
MTTKEANSKASKLFSLWRKEFCNTSQQPDKAYYKKLEDFKKECESLHNVGGVYKILTDKNALKMASICSSIRFVEPYRMLMQLQHTTNSY